jgi:hypothetical protein
MDKAKSKRLVIDADVVCSACGKGTAHPSAKHCCDFLQAVLDICHCIVVTPTMQEEWKRHTSSRVDFFRTWRGQMISRKKMVVIDPLADRTLSLDVEKTAKSDNDLDAVRKDIHLIHAALAADRSIVSCDDTARHLFGNASSIVPALSPIVWVNPGREEEEPIRWLEGGTEAEPDRMLCRQRK